VCIYEDSITFSIASVEDADSYDWTVPPGASIMSGQGDTTITVQFDTVSGTVTVTPENSCGIGEMATHTITVNSGVDLFQKTIGGPDYDFLSGNMEPTVGGGYYVTGFTWSYGAGFRDWYMMKIDADANVLWTKIYGGSNRDDTYDIKSTDDGGFMIAGTTKTFGQGDGDAYIAKLDSSGALIWNKVYGTGNFEGFNHIRKTDDGGFVFIGLSLNWSSQNGDILLMKTDSAGNELWTRTFGGPGIEQVSSITDTDDGGYHLVGQTNSYGAGDYDIYLLKLDSAFNLEWTKTFGGTGIEEGGDITATSDGGYMLTGMTESFGAGGSDMYWVKLDSTYNVLWSKTYGDIGDDVGGDLTESANGDFLAVGTYDSLGFGKEDIMTLKIAANGNVLSSHIVGGPEVDEAGPMKPHSNGGFLIFASTASYGAGKEDIYVLKTNDEGETDCNEMDITLTVTSPITLTGTGGSQGTTTLILTTPTLALDNSTFIETLHCSTCD
jgi:hypothetical protein